jgi:excisionase family DNA binding protein
MTMLNRQKFEVVACSRERIVRRPVTSSCPVCGQPSELLTTRQAAALLQVRPACVRRWLAQGHAHGVRTPGGQHRVCRRSLFANLQSLEVL